MIATAEPVPMFTCTIGRCDNRVVKRGTVCTESRGGTRTTAPHATAEQNAAYRAGLCVGLCGERYSAGRPRCDACHAEQVPVIEPGLMRREVG